MTAGVRGYALSPMSDTATSDGASTAKLSAELRRQYARRFADQAEYRRAVWSILVREAFQPRLGADLGTVVEIGCGWGEFIDQVRAERRIALDLNPDAPQHLGPGVEFHLHDCAEPWPVPDAGVDGVFTSNLLEHLADKAAVQRTLEHAFAALRPGGRIVCLGPNIRFVGGAYWDFYDHVVPLTDRSLAEVLELAGFRCTERIDRFLPYTMSEGGVRAPVSFVGLYLKLRPAWRLLGKQFLLVAEKP